MSEKQVTLTETEANTAIMLMKMGVHSVPPENQNFDGVIDAYVAIRNKISAGKPVTASRARAK